MNRIATLRDETVKEVDDFIFVVGLERDKFL